MNGNHRPAGVLFLSKPTVAGAARLEDVAPTVLAELGVAAPRMDGAPLLGAGSRTGGNEDAHEDQPYSQEQAQAVEARLRALGYLE